MSYSISATGATKSEARANIEKQFDLLVIPHQPIHLRDKAAALTNVDAMLSLIVDEVPENQAVHISLSGSVSWRNYPSDKDPASAELIGASANAYVFFGAKND